MSTFEAGSVVVLKSGGPKMTVSDPNVQGTALKEAVGCTWIDNDGNQKHDNFEAVTLELWKPQQPKVMTSSYRPRRPV